MFRKIIFATLLLSLFVLLYSNYNYLNSSISQISNQAAVFFSDNINVLDLVKKFANSKDEEKIKILLVPGHEPNFGGTEYGGIKERDINLALSGKIKNILEKNPKFEVISSRDKNGWNPELASYIKGNKSELGSWINNQKSEMHRLIKNGQVKLINSEVGHVSAPTNSALYLYGINKWAAINKIEIAIHIHMNDNERHNKKPLYEGFSIYVPEKQYSNSTGSKILAQSLMAELSKIQKISTLKTESGGIIEEQELIALGSHNSADSLSTLIEYAYIYEDQLQNSTIRNNFLDKAAASTAQSLYNFLTPKLSLNLDKSREL